MESREVHHPPGPPLPPQSMMMSQVHGSGYASNSGMIVPNPNVQRFPFNSLIQQPAQPTQSAQQPRPIDSVSPGGFDGSATQIGYNTDPAKKKRGRPRKYAAAEGNIGLQLATSPIPSSGNHVDSVGIGNSGGGGGGGGGGGTATSGSSEPSSKRNRGRPPGSVKKQLDALGGTGGVGFTPHVITVGQGQDIAEKIREFSHQGPRKICILSANGAICNVTLRQPAVVGGSVTYEGRFEIISLSGSLQVSDANGNHEGAGGLFVSMAGPDGKVVGGGVSGMLTAASAVQVIVGSFIADAKKQTSNSNAQASTPTSLSTPQMLNFAAPRTSASTPSQGASSESSDENGDGGSPIHRVQGFYGNTAPSIHNNGMQMYHPLWTNHTQQ